MVGRDSGFVQTGENAVVFQHNLCGAAAALFIVFVFLPGEAGAEGRYILQEREGSAIIFDSDTGRMSVCAERSGGRWACELVPDERRAFEEELARLNSENDQLREQIIALGGKPEVEESQDTFSIPSREEVDAMMDFFEDFSDRMIQLGDRLRDRLGTEGAPGEPLPLPQE